MKTKIKWPPFGFRGLVSSLTPFLPYLPPPHPHPEIKLHNYMCMIYLAPWIRGQEPQSRAGARMAVLGSPSLIVLTVSVHVKQHRTCPCPWLKEKKKKRGQKKGGGASRLYQRNARCSWSVRSAWVQRCLSEGSTAPKPKPESAS